MPRLDRPDDSDFRQRYGVLLDIARVLTATLEPPGLYRTIYEQASRVLETTGFYVSLLDAEIDEANVVFIADRGTVERPASVTYRGSESRAIREKHAILDDLTSVDHALLVLGPEKNDDEVTRSVLVAPMVHHGRVLGVISAQSYRRHAYTAGDVELLTAIADLAAVAVSNSRAIADLEGQRRESQRLEEIGRALTASLELDQVLRRIVAAARDLFDAEGASVWLLQPDGMAEVAMSAGDLSLPVGATVHPPLDLIRRFTEERAPLIVDRLRSDPLIPSEIRQTLESESAIAVPLIANDQLIGALSVSHASERAYEEDDVRLLERLALHAAIAVSNARLHDQVRTLSLTDPLTELPNRRHMSMFLEKEFAAAERGRSLTLILFDLDDFKHYNDMAGHQAGDAVLRRFARILLSQTRAMNLAARYGGDEFIIILSEAEPEDGDRQVQRVLDAVLSDARMAGVGVTAGVAAFEPGMQSPDQLVRRADQALYRAKSARTREESEP